MKKVLFIFALLLAPCAHAQLWSGILAPTSGAGACTLLAPGVSNACAIDWTTAGVGGIPLRPTACTVLPASSCPGGSSDCTPTIQAALNACTPGDNLSLQAGTYRVNTTISVPSNITLRCATPDLCILNSFVTSGPVVKAGTGWSAGTEVAATGATAGATVLTPTSTSGFTTGYALVSMTNDGSVATSYGGEGVCSFCDDYWSGARSTQQLVQTTISGSTLIINPPLRTDFSLTQTAPAFSSSAVKGQIVSYSGTLYVCTATTCATGPTGANWQALITGASITPITMTASYAGIENLQVYANNTGYSTSFYLGGCSFCWVAGDESNYTDGDFAEVEMGYHDEVRDNYFSNGYSHTSGSTDNDIVVRLGTSDSLVENNIIERGHSSIMFERGGMGNVAGYNYATGEFDSGYQNAVNGSIGFHGANPEFTLLEGNKAKGIGPDEVWGSNVYTTMFRNYGLGTTPDCNPLTGRATVNCSPLYFDWAGGNPSTAGWWPFQASRSFGIDHLSIYTNLIGNVAGSAYQSGLYPYCDNTTGSGCTQAVSVASVNCGTLTGSTCANTRSFDSDNYNLSFGYGESSDTGSGTGCSGSIVSPCHSPNAFNTAFQHGNYTYANNTITWSGSVTHTLPASFYHSSQPAWWPTLLSYPAIGPDVTSGTAQSGTHANLIPAENCFVNVMGGSPGGAGSPLTFNPNSCYASSIDTSLYGTCNFSQSISTANGLIYGVVQGPPGPPFFGGSFCGNGLSGGGTETLTIGALPNMWTQTNPAGTPTCPIASVPVGGNCYPLDYGATGAGSVAINNAGMPFARVTDRYTCPVTTYSGEQYITPGTGSFNSDNTAVYAYKAAGYYIAELFNSANFVPGTTTSPFTTLKSSPTGSNNCTNFGSPIAPASKDPHKLYSMTATTLSTRSGVTQWDWTGCIANPTACNTTSGNLVENILYDVAAPGNILAPPANGGYAYNATYVSLDAIDSLDMTFFNALSNNQGRGGGQDTGTLSFTVTTSGPPSYSLTGYGGRVWNSGYPAMSATNQGEVALGPHANYVTNVSTSGSTITASSGTPFSSSDTWVIELAGIGTATAITTGSTGGCTASLSNPCVTVSGTSLPPWAAGNDATEPGTPVELNTGPYLIQHVYTSTLFSLTMALSTAHGAHADATVCATSCAFSFGSLYNATYATSTTLTVTPIQTMYNGSLVTSPFNGTPGTQTGLTYIAGIPPGYIEGDWGPTGVVQMSGCDGITGICQNGPTAGAIHDTDGGPGVLFHISGFGSYCLTPFGCSGGNSRTPGEFPDGNNDVYWDYLTLNVFSASFSGHGNTLFQSRVQGTGSTQQLFFPLIDSAGDWGPGYSNGGSNITVTDPSVLPVTPTGLATHASALFDNPSDTMAVGINSEMSPPGPFTNNMLPNGCVIPYPLWSSSPNCGTGNPNAGALTDELFLQQIAQIPGSSPLNTQACAVVEMTNGTCGTSGSTPMVCGNYGATVQGSTEISCSNTVGSNTPMPIVRLGANYITTVGTSIYAATGYLDTDQLGRYVMWPSDYMCTLGMAPTNVGSPVCGGPDWFPGNPYNLNDVITPLTDNGVEYEGNCTYYASGAGTSGGTHPTWLSGTTCLSPVTDGGVTWTLIGKQNMGIDVFIVGTIPYGSSPPSAPLGLVPQVFTKNNPPWRDSLGGNSQ